ncbi:cAMP-dependent protein kinase type II regulatory subunit-like, partial [Stegodyphus dumicola]|uniref:cAMP-dependent protein kinase type II regulatory subunit-like n=1 Tax=Stegodyphus dumicola TaxID=202533 RepID=UPI0015B1A94A
HFQRNFIYYDSISALKAVGIFSDTENLVVVEILKLNKNLSSHGYQMFYCWVPGHTGIKGNKVSDITAKTAVEVSSQVVPFRDITKVIKQEVKLVKAGFMLQYFLAVFAEQYNPEDDEDDDVERIIYPKSDEQRQRLGEAVRNILLFRSLDLQQMQEVLDAMFERKVKPGDIVIKQGDDGDNFYVIDSGVYHIYVDTDQEKNKLVGKYDNAGSFGELALMYNMPRAATIEAVTEGSLWAMNRQTFRRIVLKSAFKKRKEYENLLNGVPMLQTLENYERMNLCDALMPKSYSDGELIIKQGDEADGMYFIEDGSVKITMIKETDDNKEVEMEVTTLTKGQYFGELALVTQKPRAASAYAVGNVKLAFLDVAAFERLLGPCMAIMSRNVDHYRQQVVELFGSEANISDLR